MSCNWVRDALPLLPGDEPQAEQVREHLEQCEDCRVLHLAYLADEETLLALGRSRQVPPGLLDGLADRVLAEARREPRPLPQERAGAPVLRLVAALAAAAAVLFAVALTVAKPDAPAGDGPVVARSGEQAPTAPQLDLPRLTPPEASQPSAPAPARRVRAGRAGRSDVVPAAGGQRPMSSDPLEELLRRGLPGLRSMFPPPRPGNEEEVSF